MQRLRYCYVRWVMMIFQFKKQGLIILILALATGCGVVKRSNKTAIANLSTDIYVLNYHYEETPSKILWSVGNRRVVNKDQAFCILNYDPKDLSKSNYKACFDKNGKPLGYGGETDYTKVYDDSVRLSFMGRDTTVRIKSAMLANPANLWFWKYCPKVNEKVIVTVLLKNFIKKTIDKAQTSYTYLGLDTIKINNVSQSCYLVYSEAVNGQKGVFDRRWYDKNGMVVKEIHTVGKDGSRIAELLKIVPAK